MSFGAEARARLAVLPVCALVFPWRCSLGLPVADRGDPAPPASIEQREPPAPPAAPDPRAVPSPVAAPRVPAGSTATEKREVLPQRVLTGVPHTAPAVHAFTLPEEVVLKAISVGQRQFLRCWTKAQRDDPGIDSAKVRLHLDVDAAGRVTAVKSDTAATGLARCLAVVARQLRFPAPRQPAVVDVPLMFP